MNRAERRALQFQPFNETRANYQPSIFTAMLDYNGIQAEIWHAFESGASPNFFWEDEFYETEDCHTLAIPLMIGNYTYYTYPY